MIPVLIQLFWFSFIFIGLAALLVMRSSFPQLLRRTGIQDIILHNHIGIGFVVSFMAALCCFLIPCALAYIFEWPLFVIKALYIALLGLSVVVLVRNFDILSVETKRRLTGLSKQQLLLGIFVIVLVVIRFMAGIHVGGGIDDDSPLHVARLQHIINLNHFTFADPILGYNGDLLLGYSVDLLNSLQTIMASTLHIYAYSVWYYSFAFYYLLMSVSLFALGRVFLPKNVRSWAYAVLLFAPVVGNRYIFLFPELQHSIVLMWTSLLLIGLKLLLDKRNGILAVAAACLIASTHAIASLYAFVFIFLLCFVLLLAKLLTKRVFKYLVACMLVLAIPVIVNAIIGNRASASTGANSVYYGMGLHERFLAVYQYGHVLVPKLHFGTGDYYLKTPFFDLKSVISYMAIGGAAVLFKRIEQQRYKKILIWLVMIAVLGAYNVYYVSAVFYVFMVCKAKQKSVKLLLALTFLFFALTTYNPIFLSIVFGHVALWIVARFQELNVFVYMAPYLGLLVIFRQLAIYWRIPKLSKGYPIFVLCLLVVFLPYQRAPINYGSYINSYVVGRSRVAEQYSRLLKFKDFDPIIRNQIVYADTGIVIRNISYMTTGAKFGMVYNDQTGSMQNLKLRTQCSNDIVSHLDYVDLRASKAQQLILDATGKRARDKTHIALADSKPYLKFEAQIHGYRLYKVDTTRQIDASGSKHCNIPYRQ